MAKIRTYVCPSCRRQFDYMQHPSTAPEAPRFCPLCGFDTEGAETSGNVVEFDRAVTSPTIRKSAIVQSVDGLYRDMERASEANMERAAEMAGCDVSEMSALKITDMPDNLRAGDLGIKTPDNPITDAMRAQPGVTGFQNSQAVAEFARTAHGGVDHHAGASAMSMVNRVHSQIGEAMVRAGQQGKY